MDDTQIEKSLAEFTLSMGQTAMLWAELENCLCVIFSHICRMDKTLARRVFYSARSFQGRLDMLKASVDCPTTSLHVTDEAIIKQILKVCRMWVGYRNAIAHDRILFLEVEGHSMSGKHVIIDGKFDRFLDTEEKPIDLVQMENIRTNFSDFVILCHLFLTSSEAVPGEGKQVYLSLLQALPSHANTGQMPPHEKERLSKLVPPTLDVAM